jgi:hypothetical protein
VTEQQKNPFYERYLAPYALFLGIILSFGACCVAGYVASHRNCFTDFERFHYYINIGSLFYPTALQVRSLAKARLDPDKIVVVVGGSSILYGTGQRPEHLWTRKLQSLLGDRYQVINFAMPGAHLTEFGGAAAEILSCDYPRLIFLTDPGPACTSPDPDGLGRYQYFFWDAYSKGLLTHDQPREERLAELAVDRSNNDKFAELKTQMRLDSCLYFRDLWTTISYRRAATVWSPGVGSSFTKARQHYRDPDVNYSLPLDMRYPASDNDINVEAVRGRIQNSRKYALRPIPRHTTRDDRGSEGRYTSFLERSVKLGFPEPFRKRTLMPLTHESPYYVDQLASHEKAAYNALFPATAHVLEQAGFPTIEIGRDYPVSAFCDRGHLSEEGGARMAEELAPKIREMAQRLGYLPEGGSR